MKECTMTAKTVEEAIELACDRIGLPREEVEIEIIDLPKKGFFGIGGKKGVHARRRKGEHALPFPDDGTFIRHNLPSTVI